MADMGTMSFSFPPNCHPMYHEPFGQRPCLVLLPSTSEWPGLLLLSKAAWSPGRAIGGALLGFFFLGGGEKDLDELGKVGLELSLEGAFFQLQVFGCYCCPFFLLLLPVFFPLFCSALARPSLRALLAASRGERAMLRGSDLGIWASI